MKKLVAYTVVSSAITFALAALLSIFAPFLYGTASFDMINALVMATAFVLVFVWFRHLRDRDGAKSVHRDYPEKMGVYSLMTDLKIMLKGERQVFALFAALAVIAHLLGTVFYNKPFPFAAELILICIYPFGVMNIRMMDHMRIGHGMLPVTAILLFVSNVVFICLLYIIVLSVLRRKWFREWVSM